MLGAIARKEVLVEFQAGKLFEYGNAIFFSATRVYGGFVNDVTSLEHFAHRFTGIDEWREVWALVFVDRCWHGDDKTIAPPQIIQLGTEAQPLSLDPFTGRQSEAVGASLESKGVEFDPFKGISLYTSQKLFINQSLTSDTKLSNGTAADYESPYESTT